MPWITPRTWIKGDFPTVGRLNVDLRDNMAFLNTVLGARVRNTVAQSIPNNVQTQLTYWDTEDYDSDNCHSASLQGRLVINTAGKYVIGSTMQFAAGGTNLTQKYMILYVTRAGVDTAIACSRERTAGGGDENTLFVEGIHDCQVADYARVEVFQNTGGALNATVVGGECMFFAQRICA